MILCSTTRKSVFYLAKNYLIGRILCPEKDNLIIIEQKDFQNWGIRIAKKSPRMGDFLIKILLDSSTFLLSFPLKVPLPNSFINQNIFKVTILIN